MNIKKIIKEEINDFEWTESIMGIPDGEFMINLCDKDVLEKDILTEVMTKLENKYQNIYPDSFTSNRIHRSITSVLLDEEAENGNIVLYIRPVDLLRIGQSIRVDLPIGSSHVGWDNCVSYDDGYEQVFSYDEFMGL